MKKITLMYDFMKELGGIERVMASQSNTLSKKYFVENLFSFISDKNKDSIIEELNFDKKIKFSQIKRGNNESLQYIASILFPRRIFGHKTDLILSHSFMSSRMALHKKKIDGTPYIVMLHHPPQLLYGRNIKWVNNLPRFFGYLAGSFIGPIMKSWDKEAVRKADSVFVNSEYTAKRIKEIYGVQPMIIYPSFSEEFKIINREKAEKTLEKRSIKKNFILIHGRIIRDKRPDFAIASFSLLAKKYPDLDLVISGTIEEKKSIQKYIKERGISERVHLLGRVSSEELVALYNLAKCFLMTAPKEDFGLTPIEAMACGCPVVGWKDGAGPEETILDGKNGFLSNPYNIKDFSDKIEKCLGVLWGKTEIRNSVRKFSELEFRNNFSNLVTKVL